MQFLLLFSILLLCIALFIGPRLQWKISINPCNIEEEKKPKTGKTVVMKKYHVENEPEM